MAQEAKFGRRPSLRSWAFAASLAAAASDDRRRGGPCVSWLQLRTRRCRIDLGGSATSIGIGSFVDSEFVAVRNFAHYARSRGDGQAL
jgi:hypothetical protein